MSEHGASRPSSGATVDLSTQLLATDASLPEALTSLVERLAPGAAVVPLWRNELGGITVRIDPPRARSSLVLKFSPPGREVDVADERARLDWAGAFHPVPRVLESGDLELDEGARAQWLLMTGLPGESAVTERWRRDPRAAVRAIGEGLRLMHDSLPVERCPFIGPELTGDSAPPVDRLVVAHGDACAPNTLLDDHGRFLAHVDLGALGVADRWSDLAIASMSLEWNFGSGWEGEFFAAYGVDADHDRNFAWRERWHAAPSGQPDADSEPHVGTRPPSAPAP